MVLSDGNQPPAGATNALSSELWNRTRPGTSTTSSAGRWVFNWCSNRALGSSVETTAITSRPWRSSSAWSVETTVSGAKRTGTTTDISRFSLIMGADPERSISPLFSHVVSCHELLRPHSMKIRPVTSFLLQTGPIFNAEKRTSSGGSGEERTARLGSCTANLDSVWAAADGMPVAGGQLGRSPADI